MNDEPRIRPLDEHNRQLLEHVHPPDHTNPEPASRYHLVVIGAGTAGLICAAGAAALGARVALIERHLMGGDCLNVGCVPSKSVIRAARAWHESRHAAALGAPAAEGDGDFGRAMERMRRLRAGISPHDSVDRFRKLGIDVFLGDGRFTGPDIAEVDGRRLSFRRAVIATGGRATGLPIEGLEDAGYLTNETVFELESRPARMIVIGAGPIGCELAQAFARFGTEVTILDLGDHVLPREDPDAADIVQQAMIRDGVRYLPNTKILAARRDDAGTRTVSYEREGRPDELVADEILVGVGRTPNIEGLGLDEAGVRYEKSGVVVDDYLRTTNKRIYAAGDVCSALKFTHLSEAHARIVIQNALFFGWSKQSKLVIPWCTYTSPEIAHVGMYEKDAREKGIEVDTITLPMDGNDRAVLDSETEGFLRVHLRKGSDRMLGATLVAAHAGEMIGELALAITHGIGLSRIGTTIHPYPTQGEVIRRAADTWRRGKLTPRVKKAFELFFRVFR